MYSRTRQARNGYISQRARARQQLDEFLRAKADAGDIPCFVCSVQQASTLHHIKPRSRGGDQSAENLLHVCYSCHRRIHDNPMWARENDYTR